MYHILIRLKINASSAIRTHAPLKKMFFYTSALDRSATLLRAGTSPCVYYSTHVNVYNKCFHFLSYRNILDLCSNVTAGLCMHMQESDVRLQEAFLSSSFGTFLFA